MALEKQIKEEVVRITPEGTIVLQRRVEILEDGQIVGRQSLGRDYIHPGSDVTDKPDQVKQIASMMWTAEKIKAWKANHPDHGNPEIDMVVVE